MGKVRFGIPQELALKLASGFGLRYFIETGTYKAGTSCWASEHFEHVWTVEGWEEYYRKNAAAHAGNTKISFLFGDSRVKLPEILALVHEPALIWLDAHWLGNAEISGGTDGECPIREEIAALKASGQQHFILIDDARCFTGDLPGWSDPRLWPSLADLKRWLPGYYVIVHEDVIIAVPPAARALVDEHIQRPGVAVLVLTSNGYVHLLGGFAYMFNKFWSPTQDVTALRYDKRPPWLPANFYAPAAGKQAELSFTAGLRLWLELHYPADQFILMLEDYYLCEPVDTARLRELWNWMRAHPDVDKLDLSGDLAKRDNPIYDDGLLEAHPSDPFRSSLQAAIWRRGYLIEQLAHDLNPWQFEKHTGKSGRVLGVKDPVLRYVNAVGGAGNRPGQYDLKKIPSWMMAELKAKGLL